VLFRTYDRADGATKGLIYDTVCQQLYEQDVNAIRRLMLEYRELRRFQNSQRHTRQIVVYCENHFSWSYFKPFVDLLLDDEAVEVTYLTSSHADPFLNDPPARVHAYVIGEGTMRTIAFAAMEADVVLMTTPGLGTTYLRRSPHVGKYVYVPHSMASMHMVYPKGSFDGFDAVFCVGPHQERELRETEAIYGLEPKQLFQTGYVKLDTIIDEARACEPAQSEGAPVVAIAPTWGADTITDLCGEALIQCLLDAGCHVILRPHHITVVTEAARLDALTREFADRPNFKYDSGLTTKQVYEAADVLITDWSGAAFSFGLGLLKPVLFVDTPKKIKNAEYDLLENRPVEIQLRERMGAVLALADISLAAETVTRLVAGRERWRHDLEDLREKVCHRAAPAASTSAECIRELLNEQQGRVPPLLNTIEKDNK